MAERAAEACVAWGNGSPVAGFSASQTARRALLHDGGYRTGDRVSNKKCSILFEWNIFYCNFKGILSQKRGKRITAPSPKNPPACGSILSSAEPVSTAGNICLNDFRQHIRKKQQSGAVQNNTVSHLRGFVLFAHGVSLLRFCTRIRYFFQNVNIGRNND